jgi:anti-sigma-K factor RskA
MTDTNHDRWAEDVAAYMLGALEPGEAAELERHAEGCERCREQIRWLTPAVQGLPEAVERLQPPRELRSRVMTEVRSDARRAGSDESGALARAAAWLRGLGSGPMGLRPVAGIATAVLVVAAIGGFAVSGGIGGAGDNGTTTYAAGKAPGVTAHVVTETDGTSATLHLANVRQLPSERVLEAWVQRDGEVHAVRALFVPDRDGHASTTIANMQGVETVMVTTEPPGGSEAPTSSPIVTIPIPQ